MTRPVESRLVTEVAEVERIVAEIRSAGIHAFDLEFVAEARLVPELALVQLAWGEPGSPEIALVDCTEVDASPIFAVIEDPSIETIAHAAGQDLSLLRIRYDVCARRLMDTQIAAAFLGLGDQVGYGRLVEELTSVRLNKGAQYTNWLRRPLSERQLTYAANDVRYLQACWGQMASQLEERGRRHWVDQACEEQLVGVKGLPDPETAYMGLRGWRALRNRQLGALRALARWRLEIATSENLPLSWVVPDKTAIDLCKRIPKDRKALRRARDLPDKTFSRYGDDILSVLQAGSDEPVDTNKSQSAVLTERGQVWAAIANGLVHSLANAAQVSHRFVANRASVDDFVLAVESGTLKEDATPLLQGWRRELVGEKLLGWLRGDYLLAIDHDGPGSLQVVER